MREIKISTEEKVLLKNHIRTSPLSLIRCKCQAILMREKQLMVEDIGEIVSRKGSTITKWIREWQVRRMASIFTGHKDNKNARKLNQEQLQTIKEVLRMPPTEQGLPVEFWDVPSLKKYVKATFEVVYESDRSYHFLLKFGCLSFKYPDTFDRKRDEIQIKERMSVIHETIAPFLDNPDWEVFASDEVRIELEAITRRAWLKRGERTVVKVNRTREAQSYFGLLNQKSWICHLYEMQWQNQEEVLKALEIFLKEYPNKKICIVWDNASFHKGIQIRKALQSGGILERVHLVALPPYAPDKNPIEHVWNTAKCEISNIQHDTFLQTKEAFISYINNRQFAYHL